MPLYNPNGGGGSASPALATETPMFSQTGERVGVLVNIVDVGGPNHGAAVRIYDDAALNTETFTLSDGSTFIGAQT